MTYCFFHARSSAENRETFESSCHLSTRCQSKHMAELAALDSSIIWQRRLFGVGSARCLVTFKPTPRAPAASPTLLL